ncbi:hypothetical protein D3C79_920370 [compost metagenome]
MGGPVKQCSDNRRVYPELAGNFCVAIARVAQQQRLSVPFGQAIQPSPYILLIQLAEYSLFSGRGACLCAEQQLLLILETPLPGFLG